MTDRQIEQRLRAAIERTAPNDVDRLLSELENGKGATTMTNNKTVKTRRSRFIGIVAACLALVLIGGAGGLYYGQNYIVATVVSLDVNPSIELSVSPSERVISCTALNDEAREILASMDGGADLEGTKLNVAVNSIVGAIVRAGYLDSLSSAILISVEDNDSARGARLQEKLVAEVDGVLQAASNEAGVLSQSMTVDRDLDLKARENNISAGKAALVDRVLEINPALDFAALAELSVEELRDLIAIGAPAMPIGKPAALAAVLREAGIAAADALRTEVDPELDDPAPHYEVELTLASGELEYTVDAFTGAVLSPAAPQPTDIGEAAAKAAALKDAGIGEADLTYIKVKRDTDDGRTVYDVEFATATTEYDYEIDASTGSILKRDSEPINTPVNPQPTDIGEAAAKSAALKDAGIGEADLTYIKVKRDTDDGRTVYDVDFATASAEYDYEIDASTGTVVKRESESINAPVNPQPADIGEDAAKAAALKDAGIGEADLTYIKVKRDTDDGRAVYDVDFATATTEYDYEIDAATGNILKRESEPINTPVNPQPTDIGEAAAKAAALKDAGIGEADLTYIKVKRDTDDGRTVYDVEFATASTEYDYEIDASTGDILKRESEPIAT